MHHRSREHTTVSNSSRTGAAGLEEAGLESWEAGQERQTGLATTVPQVHDRETDVGRQAGTQGLHEKAAREQTHLLAGDQALRVAAGFGLARFCTQVRLAALTEHEERYTVASESLPANDAFT